MGFGLLAGCPADDGEGSGDTEDTSTGSMTMSSTTMAMSTSSSTSSSSSSTTDDTTTTDETTMSMPDSSSSGESMTDTDTDTATDSASSSSSGGGDATYPACQPDADPVCPKPYTGCYDVVKTHSACTVECEDPDACPEPNGGTAVPVCGGPMMDSCVLDCSGDATCPDGMECVEIVPETILRCLWLNEA
jgi:hypothetical protein